MKYFLFKVEQKLKPIFVEEVSSNRHEENFHHSAKEGVGIEYIKDQKGRISEFVVEAMGKDDAQRIADKLILPLSAATPSSSLQ